MTLPVENEALTDPQWKAGWSLDLHIWLERGGQAVLGPGRIELLQGIDRLYSISAAARQMGMSYRRAWEMVQSMNSASGEPVVSAAPGGVHGGGAQLTSFGQWLVVVFSHIRSRLCNAAGELLPLAKGKTELTGIHLAAAVSLEEVLGQLLTDFSVTEQGMRVRTVFGASDELAEHLLAGTHADLFLSADPLQLDRLESAGLLAPGPHQQIARNGLAIIGPADRDVGIGKPADMAMCSGLRIALADPTCPLGGYTQLYLRGMHIYESILTRVLHVENSRAVAGAIRGGQADVGLVYTSDTRQAGCQLLFRARHRSAPIRYFGAILKRANDPPAAQRLLDFLASRTAAQRFRDCGFRR